MSVVQVSSFRFWRQALCPALFMLAAPAGADSAAVVVPVTATVSVGAAANGVPLVNIAAPNAGGVSHNQYTQFDVGSGGLLLNNTAQPANTQLGGMVVGNPNLGAGSAHLILNEVVSAHASQLNGYLEVAGTAASVVVANPWGITCQGCGFINTPSAALVAGAPIWAGTALTGWQISSGVLRLDGSGLNASNTEQLALYGRVLQLNAALYANNLAVVTGQNTVNASTGAAIATPSLATGTAPAPASFYSIDSTALGGMYANRITLIGTEAGVGMRLGSPVAALTGNLSITAAGDVQLVRASAAQDLTLTSAGTIGVAASTALNADGSLLPMPAGLNAGGHLTLSAAGALATASTTTITGHDIDVDAGSVSTSANSHIAAVSHLNLHTGLANLAGTVASQDSLTLAATALQNAGVVASEGLLTIAAPTTAINNQHGVLQGGAGIVLTAAGLDNRSGQVLSNGAVLISAGSLANADGRVETTGNLTLNLPSFERAMSAGELRAGGQFTLHSQGDITLNGAALITPGSLDFISDSGNIFILSRVEAGHNISARATAIGLESSGFLAAAGALSSHSTSLNNLGVIYGKTGVTLAVEQQLTNGSGVATAPTIAAILSEGDISLANSSGGRMQALTNNGGIIESLLGNIRLSAGTVSNLNIGWGIAPASPADTTSTFAYSINAASFDSFHYCCQRWGEDTPSTRIETQTTQHLFSALGQAGTLVAAGDIRINASSLLNDHSLISAGATLDITAALIQNNGTVLTDDITNIKITHWHACEYDNWNNLDCWPVTAGPLISHYLGEVHVLPGILEGRHSVELHGTVINGSAAHTGQTATANTGMFAGLGLTAADLQSHGMTGMIDPTALPGFHLPNNGLFHLLPPGHGYLIETDPALNTYAGFLGSGYLLAHLNWSPSLTQTRLGDSYYELSLVRAALMAALGTRFINAAVADEREQYEYLMSNAIAAASSLQLSPGIALTREQIDALQADMVWLEERAFNGSKVLVPVLYLAGGSARLLQDGSVIGGGSVAISGSHFSNTGLIHAQDNLAINSQDGLENRGGTLSAGAELSAISGGDLLNESGHISGQTVSLVAAGNIVHRTWSASDSLNTASANSQTTSHSTLLGEQASVVASGSQHQTAGGDIQVTGGALSGGDVQLRATGNLLFDTVQLAQGYRFNSADWQQAEDYVWQLHTRIDAAHALTLEAGASLTAIAAQLSAGGNASLSAGNHLQLLAATNQDRVETHSQHSGTFSDSRQDSLSTTTQQQGSSLTAGGNLNLNAGTGSVVLYGSSAHAAGSASVQAGAGIALIAGVNTQTQSLQTSHTTTATFTQHSEGFITQTAAASQLSSDGDLHLNTAGNIAITASALQSKATLHIGDSAFLSGTLTGAANQPNAAANTAITLPANLTVSTLALTNEHWDRSQSGLRGPFEDLVKGFAALTAGMVSGYTAGQADIPSVSIGHHTNTASTTVLQAGSTLTAQALDARVQNTAAFIGATVQVAGTLAVSAHDIVIDAAAETQQTTHSEGSNTVQGLGLKADADAGEVRVAGVQTTNTSTNDSTQQTQWRGSSLNAGQLILTAENTLSVLGSTLSAAQDAQLSAGNTLTISGREGELVQTHQEKTEVVTVAAAVRNAYVDAGLAIKALASAADALKAANAAYNDAKRRADLGQLDPSDVDFFVVNLAAATANLTQATIAATASVASAALIASSSMGTGFYVSGSAQREVTTTHSSNTQSQWQGSALTVGGNASLQAGKALTLEGSSLTSTGALTLNAAQITLSAGSERSAQTSKTTQENDRVSVSVSPASVSANVNASLRQTDADSSSLHYINSHISAGSLTSTSDALRVAGAQVIADDVRINTGRFVVASLQDQSNSRSQTQGVSAGMGVGTAGVSSLSGGMELSNSEDRSLWVTEQTHIIGRNSIVIRAQDSILTGAVIANASRTSTGQLEDHGGLDFTTNTLVTTDLFDESRQKTTGFNVSTSSSLNPQPSPNQAATHTGTTTFGGQYLGHQTDQTTHATLGAGRVLIGGQDLASTTLGATVNRSLNLAQEITRDQDIGGLNATVTVDHRWFSESGRAEIKSDAEHFGRNIQLMVDGIAKDLDAALPDSSADNKWLHLAGVGLDHLGLPSAENHGGVLSEATIVLGADDIHQQQFTVASAESTVYKDNSEKFIPAEQMPGYSQLDEPAKAQLAGMFVSREAIQIDASTVTKQNFTNGMLNNFSQAVVNGMEQAYGKSVTGANDVVFTLNFNPSHGGLSDLLEAGMDSVSQTQIPGTESGDRAGIKPLTWFNTGAADVTAGFMHSVISTTDKANFVAHSQGNLLMYAALPELALSAARTPLLNETLDINVVMYGSPVGNADMQAALKSSGIQLYASASNDHDAVAWLLGGNKNIFHVETQPDISKTIMPIYSLDRLKTLADIPLFFTGTKYAEPGKKQSPHSSYDCIALCGGNP